MKKLVAILLIAAFAIPAFANDATVLPAGVIRARVIPTYAFGDQSFDADGKKVDIGYKVTAINLGFAVEYGISDWMTLGLQWAPGWTLWSQLDPDPAALAQGTTNVNGLNDLFAGLAIQVVGSKAPVVSDTFRFVATPAVIIPLPGMDVKAQVAEVNAALMAGKAFDMTAKDADKHAFAIGTRLSGDYIINDMFYLNLCGEFKKFFERKDVDVFIPPTLGLASSATMDIAYGYELKAEFEPHFAYDLGNNSNISAGIPVTYTMWPKVEYNGVAAANTDGYSLSVTPAVSYFFLAGPLPMELTAQYGVPLMGKNTGAMNSVTLQIKTFIKF